jgi:hypothetical protein
LDFSVQYQYQITCRHKIKSFHLIIEKTSNTVSHTGDFPADEFESDDSQFPAGMFRLKKTMQAENRQKVFESDYTECYYIKNDNAVFHDWKKEAHYESYRNPVIASLTLLKEHPGSIFIVDAKNGFEDVKEDVEWGFTYFLPELKKTGCKIWGFILP